MKVFFLKPRPQYKRTYLKQDNYQNNNGKQGCKQRKKLGKGCIAAHQYDNAVAPVLVPKFVVIALFSLLKLQYRHLKRQQGIGKCIIV